jgi:diguanylate cyclase (GGDEF)-like protein
MQKSRIYLVCAIVGAVCYGAVIALVQRTGFQPEVIIAAGMALSMLAVILVMNGAGEKQSDEVDRAKQEAHEVRQELEKMKSRFAEVTTLDELTGCSNQRYFLSLINQHTAMSVRGSYDFTLCVIQVDQFPEIVERQGLTRGNEVLVLFVRLVKAALREVDVVARMDSDPDKFGLVLSGCLEDGALLILNRVSQLIGQVKVNDKDDIKITASGGITEFHGKETREELIEHAETALQYAVAEGRDRIAGFNYIEPESLGEPDA